MTMTGCTTNRRLLGRILLLAVLATALTACCRSGAASKKNSTAAVAGGLVLLISPEDLLTVNNSTLATGPSITGSVQPERRADLRAEVSTVVLQVLKENGDSVRRGDLLVRLDDTAIRDNLNSAEASARAAAQAYEQAERQFQRLTKLQGSGMVSTQAVEDVEIRRNDTQSDLEAARTREAVARQQLQRTEVRAPFDGIVSDRKVSAGDTAQIGKELLKVIDPRSMRFEGLVSADAIGAVKTGQAVVFRVHGYAQQDFLGKVTRVNPAANVTTRQVEVLVSFTDAAQQPKLAGLYAEGRVETTGTSALTIPASAIVRDGDRAFAWRLSDNKIQKVEIMLGQRDLRSGEFALKSGLAAGDKLLRHPTSALIDGQPADLAAKPETPAAHDPS